MSFLNIDQIEAYVFDKHELQICEEQFLHLKNSFSFLSKFCSDKIIYGINTGFGPMAQFNISKGDLNQLQYNLIRSHSSGMGEPLSELYTRAVLLARINNFLQGNSGISPEVVETLLSFLNKQIHVEIFEHGGVGASGDLVQLAHLALNLIGEGHLFENEKRVKASELLKKKGIQPLKIQLRDALGIMNGTSCMTGIASVNVIYSKRLMEWAIVTSSILNELMEAYDDSFSVELNSTKKHIGQQEVANRMRKLLSDSKLIKSRATLYSNKKEKENSEFSHKIQEFYSLRCVPQILGPIWDTIEYTQRVVENEINSTNDNPIVSLENENVFHGGNFHGDYISLEMDKLKIVLCKLSMLAERQLNFLMNHKINEKFPPFLNGKKLGFNFGIQGIQFTAVSTTAENQTLSNPMYVHSISNNNDNQDIVSMGTNSAIQCKKVLDNSFQVMAIHLVAICQAIDLLNENQKKCLSSSANSIYQETRKIFPKMNEDFVSSDFLKSIVEYIKNKKIA
ncbi:MAG: aromatic amino acid lyase [Flavobacteriia bacterium]|nr:aromatic amino acid lyase [Flavobacteriia bacterium]